ncbi:hypothetical protein ACPUYX_18415 [Desulfosporosinus sp. SYSU MS00001]|uniref:hypothetical protein n=1 Tax=Desulfosporosinus sp. SYSU MS00001 TaxID=3416284 RepID=UPI003CF7072E
MLSTFFYPCYIVAAFIVVLLTIPQRDLKHYFIYGFLFGGLGDIVVVGLFQNILHIIWFKNAGVYNALGENLLSPLSWILTVMIFLRFLPLRKVFQYAYLIGFAAFSVGYGYLVHNAGLFDFQSWYYPFFSYMTFLFWWSTITWAFIKTSPLIKNPA